MNFPQGFDWMIYLPATQAFLHGQNPYLIGEGFWKVYTPFWTYICLMPFAVLPFWTGRIAVFIVGFIAFGITALKMGANRWQLVLFLTSSTVIGGLYDGNIDWLVTLGLWMPPQVGLFFVMMKPQIGVCIAVYWIYICWKQNGWIEVIRVFAPVTCAYLFSFAVYGFWIMRLQNMPFNPANVSIFPYAVPIGLLLLYSALKQYDKKLSIFSSPLFSPYLTDYTYSVSLLSLFNRPAIFIAAWIVFWVCIIVKWLFIV